MADFFRGNGPFEDQSAPGTQSSPPIDRNLPVTNRPLDQFDDRGSQSINGSSNLERVSQQPEEPEGDPAKSLPATISKILPKAIFTPESLAQFRRLNRIIKSKSPKGLVLFDEIIESESEITLIRRSLPTQPLDQPTLPRGVSESIELGLQLAKSLKQLHELGACHQNLKPCNIFVDSDKSIVLADGLFNTISVRIVDQREIDHTEILYCSPEQLGLIQFEIGPWSDLYSLGVILYQCLSGSPPYACRDRSSVVFEHVTATIKPLHELIPNIPNGLNELVLRLLKKHPGERYQTAAALIHDLTMIRDHFERGDATHCIPLGTTDLRKQLTEPSLVGRESELQELLKFEADARHGQAVMVVTESEMGLGTSRLLNEYRIQCLRLGTCVLSGAGSKELGNASFPLLDSIVDSVQEVLKKDSSISLDIPVEHQSTLAEAYPALVELIPNLRELANGATGRQGPEAFREQRHVNAICHLLLQIATEARPCVLILEDCHWASETTISIVRQLRRYWASSSHAPRWLTLVIGFTSEEVPTDHTLRKLDVHHKMTLSRLNAGQIKQLINSMAGPVPERAIQVVTESSSGNPFMVSAVLRGMVESQALVPTDQGWVLNEPRLEDLKSSREAGGFLARRIDMLSPQMIDLLLYAAVLGNTFDIAVVGDLMVEQKHLPDSDCDSNRKNPTGLHRAELWPMLDEARKKQLIRLSNDGQRASFAHDQIRNSLLARLTEFELQGRHRYAGEYLAARCPDQSAAIAIHFDSANEHQLALRYSVISAKEARAGYALAKAERLYQIAIRAVDQQAQFASDQPKLEWSSNSTDPSQAGKFHADAEQPEQINRLKLFQELGEIQMLRGNYESALQSFSQAEAMAWSSYDRSRVQGELGELAFKRGEMHKALDKLSEALKSLGHEAPKGNCRLLLNFLMQLFIQICHTCLPKLFLQRKQRLPDAVERLHLHLLSRYGHACWFASTKLRCLWAHLRSMNLAECYQPTAELAQAYSDHGPAMSLIPLIRRGIAYASRSYQIRREFGDRWGQGQALHYQGIVLFAAGRFEECINSCNQGIEYLEQTGDYWEVHMARYQVAAAHFYLGNLTEANQEALRLYRSGIELGDHQASGISLDVVARAKFGSPNWNVFEQELARDRVDTQGQAQLLIGQGVKLIDEGKYEDAETTFRLAAKTARQSGVRNVYVIPSLAWLATAIRLQADAIPGFNPQHRKLLLNRAAVICFKAKLISWPYPHIRPHLLRERGLIELMKGNGKRGVQLIRKSIRIAIRMNAKYEQQLSSYLLQKLVSTDQGKPKAKESQERMPPPAADRLFVLTQHRRTSGDQSPVTVSLADRFALLLESGRKITTALDENEILEEVKTAALRLIRGQRCITFRLEYQDDVCEPVFDQPHSINATEIRMIRSAIAKEHTCSMQTDEDIFVEANGPRSLLVSPIRVRGRLQAGFLVAHDEVAGLFLETEERLADFVGTLAGAALENADGFQRLAQLNASLESRVEQRTSELNNRAIELASSNKKLKKVALDLTNAQAELEQAKNRVELASQAKSDFLATMSHEIRTPMNAVIGMTQMCLETQLNQLQRGYLKTVQQSANSLMRILNDILDFSKIEAGKLDIEKIPLCLHAVVEDSCQLMGVIAYPKGLELTIDLNSNIPGNLLGDPGRLQQIIINLVGNAIKFTQQGHIAVSVKTISQSDSTATIEFCVADTGIGIPTEKQAKIFDSFSQADSSTTRRFGGTGLGLSICSRLISLMNGKIWVESKMGQGSQFKFIVEFERDAALRDVATPTQVILDQKSVLIISPSALTQENLKGHALQLHAKEVNVIKNFDELDSSPCYDLVILDISANGAEPYRQLEDAVAKLRQLPAPLLIVFRKDNAPTQLESLIESNRVSLLPKPITPSGLRHAISSLFITDQSSVGSPGTSVQQEIDQPIRSLQVLLAEDVEINQQIAVNVIERMGHRVTVAENGLRAIEELEKNHFDVIMMDVEMPEMDGVEATQRIRKMPRVGEIPIVAMTAHVVPEIQKRCRDAGMNDYITKPLDVNRLKTLLNQLAGTT